MERLLELPLEALVFRYSASIAGYIWTCLALFAAAIGVWRFRFLGPVSRSASAPKPPSPAASPAVPPPSPTSALITSVTVVKDCGEREESGSSPKGKFTEYFLVEEGDIAGEEMESEGERGSDGGGVECLDLFDWGWRGDLGWYNNQDRTAINGSVVRLWDGRRRGFLTAKPRRDGYQRVDWELCW